jgi:hypothetical protein
MIRFCPLSGDYKSFNISICNEDADNVQSFIKFLVTLKKAGVSVSISDEEIGNYKLNSSVIGIELK